MLFSWCTTASGTRYVSHNNLYRGLSIVPVVAAVSCSKSWKQPNKQTNKQHFKVFLFVYHLPSHSLPSIIVFHLIQWASTYFWSIWSIVYRLCHHPSTHHPFVLLCCLYLIQQSPYPGLLLSLPCFRTLITCCQFMLWLLLSFILHLNRTIPESSWIVQFQPISSNLATSKLIPPR